MRTLVLKLIIVATTAGIAAQSVQADYQSLHVRLHTTVSAGGELRDVWRVYAVFDDPSDFLTSASGSPTQGPMHIQSLDGSGQFPGGNFYNPGGDPAVTWDTAPAIGEGFLLPDGGTSANFPNFINGPELLTSAAGWFTPGPVAQGMAGNGTALPGGLWGVLTMQLTVNAGNHVRGTAAIQGVNNTPLAGGTQFQALSQTFNSFPAPASLAVFALGLIGRPRRRDCAQG